MIQRIDTESESLTQTTSDLYFCVSIPPPPKNKVSKNSTSEKREG